ncbi:hypothetical protein B0H13DRAFT_636814 [Mycena leptocephala]|nr:hypothetical protein B0H13DRAFT_636814 [Mycena leptocephala]
MTSLYVLCPTIGCGELIPKRVRCRGTVVPEHKDLYFQSCKRCKHFEWAPPPSPEPYGLVPSGPDPFPRDTSYPSPPPPASPAIDPALQAPSSAFHAAAAAAAPSNDPSKRQCVNFRQCKKLATARNCTNNMCKPCCGLKGTGCAYAAHRNSTPTPAANGNPSALARPPAVIPSTAPSSTSSLPIDGAAPILPPKEYRKPMDDVWAKQYQAGMAEQQKRREAEDEKREDMRRVHNEVKVLFFDQDDIEPERFHDQMAASRYPLFNLARSETLLRKMKLVPTDEIGLYDFTVGLWNREDVDTIIQLIPGQTLLMRRVGVTRCANIDKMLTLYAPPSRKTGKTPAHSAPSKRKPDHERDPSLKVSIL